MAEMTATHSHAHESPAARRLSTDNQKLAMWLYIASEVVIFSVFIGGYAIFRLNNPDEVFAVQETLGIQLVTINTFILLASSWAMVMGLLQMQRGNRAGMMRWIGFTALLGTIFLIGQFIEYSELAHEEIALNAIHHEFGGFGMRFYTPTAFHGAHVLIGVLWALLVLHRGRKGRYDHNPLGIEIFGLYWHFVDVVWILLFTLIYLI